MEDNGIQTGDHSGVGGMETGEVWAGSVPR